MRTVVDTTWSVIRRLASLRNGLVAGSLTKPNDVAFGVESIAIFTLFLRLHELVIRRFDESAIRYGDPCKGVEWLGHKEHRLECCC